MKVTPGTPVPVLPSVTIELTASEATRLKGWLKRGGSSLGLKTIGDDGNSLLLLLEKLGY